MNQNKMVFTGLVLLAFAVAIGAFGAHALDGIIDERDSQIFETGNRYHFIHALGILILASFYKKLHSRPLEIAAIFLSVGILLFSGSLYLLAISEAFIGKRYGILGAITPFGGVSFIIGWIYPAVGIWKKLIKKELNS